MINENEKPCEQIKRRFMRINPIDRDRRNTCTILTPASNNTTKDRRLTLNAVNWPLNMNKIDQAGIHQVSDGSITANGLIPSRDTDSSSTQDSGYSDSTPYFLVQQISPDTEQTPTVIGESKVWEKCFLSVNFTQYNSYSFQCRFLQHSMKEQIPHEFWWKNHDLSEPSIFALLRQTILYSLRHFCTA